MGSEISAKRKKHLKKVSRSIGIIGMKI